MQLHRYARHACPKTEWSRATCRRAKPTLLLYMPAHALCCARAMHAISGNLQAAETTMQQMAQVQQQATPGASSPQPLAGPSPQPLASIPARPAVSSTKSGSQPATVQRKGYSKGGGSGVRTTPAGKAAAGRAR